MGTDPGISLGHGRTHLFKKAKIVGAAPEAQIIQTVLEATKDWGPEQEN